MPTVIWFQVFLCNIDNLQTGLELDSQDPFSTTIMFSVV